MGLCMQMYVCKYMVITFRRLGFNRYGCQSCPWLSPFAPENLVLLDRCGHLVPRRSVHSSHPSLIWCLLLPPDSSPSSAFRDGAHLYRQPPSAQSRDYQVTQLRTDGVRRESAGTRRVVLKVVHVSGAADSGFTRDPLICAPWFPTPTNGEEV